MVRFLVFVLLVLFLSPPVLAQAVSNNLCDFPVEGLTLNSTKDEIEVVFGARGWHDL